MPYRFPKVLSGKSLLTRSYAVSNSAPEPIHDPSWPKNSNPTPYEVFGIPQGQIDRRKLKKRYHAMAKLYHPDMSNGVRILKSSTEMSHHSYIIDESALLSSKDKQSRFQVMNEAYELLSDSHKKSTYDRFRSGWSYSPANFRNSPYSAAATAHGYHSSPNYEYWNAGTWEEVNKMHRSDPGKRFSLWTAVAWICGLAVCVQCTALLTRIEASLTQNHFTHDETEKDLVMAYVNYGLDTDKWSRLRRFLWFRTYGMYRAKSDLDREAHKNERIVQELKDKGGTRSS
ncbi:LADA_0D11760g1_1 [Lachancea dasiensis]|uniref:LADA_0D11760g1_1 n=1 Tax=Lachancea dasiensis TaxID=1072105 RepID=A0A1G4J8N2_9SACH|nr:LADA_0D11760g1_1 [Lachancea dasiensis]